MADYDIIGSIAIIKSENKTKAQKLKEAKALLKKPSIITILEKTSDVKGRLRTIKVKHLAGINTKETIHKENNCKFKLNVETCYFSPRQSNDRKLIANKIKKKDNVLVMFSGISAYPIVIYKIKHPKHITAIEISRACNKYAKINKQLNNIPDNKLSLIQGDVKKQIPKLKQKFNIILMTRPNLSTTFLEQALIASKKNTKIFFHGFSHERELKSLKQQLLNEAKQQKRKIKITNTSKTGDIAPYKFRYRIEIKVLN
jgi:tRNA (guanine37-N1)-methyltransferase